METLENFSLQWNDFQSNLKSSYRAVRKTEDFSDMTLVCEDGQQIAAHRIILSSSSTFFRDLLARNPHSHPLVYMRAVQHSILASIVDFIYHGEAEVRKEELESFLEIAGELSVKGMTKKVKSDMKIEEETESVGNDQNLPSRHLEKQDEERLPWDDCGKTYGTKASLKTHKYSHPTHNVQEIVKDIHSTHKEEQGEVVKESFRCDECGKTYGTKASLRTHKYKTPGHVKNEKVDSLDKSAEDRYIDTSLVLEDGLDKSLHRSLDRSMDRSMDRSLDKSLDRSLDRSLERSYDKSLYRTSSMLVQDRSPMEAELEERIDAITELREGLWNCIQCGKADKKRFHLRRHAETHIEGFSHTCTVCEKTFSQRAHLKGHKLSAHPEDKIVKQFI